MDAALQELEKNFSYIINEYHIPENISSINKNIVHPIIGGCIIAGLVGIGAVYVDEKKKKITSSDIPDELTEINKEKFYRLICKYCDEKGYTETQLYDKACVSKAVYSNIRGMAIKGATYVPSKITVLCLCIALHLTPLQSQELLNLVGYSLSNNITIDKIVSWCLEQKKYEYDVRTLNDCIYEKIGVSPFIKLN